MVQRGIADALPILGLMRTHRFRGTMRGFGGDMINIVLGGFSSDGAVMKGIFTVLQKEGKTLTISLIIKMKFLILIEN